MKNKWINIFKWSSMQYVILSAIASGINYLTNILYGRMLTTEEYGIAVTMLAFIGTICVSMTPIQMLLCTLIAGKEKSYDKLNDVVIISLAINLITVLFMIVLGAYLRNYLSIVKVSEYFVVILACVLVNLFSIATGITQGQQKYIMLGLLMIGVYGIKLIVSIPLVKFGIGSIATVVGGAIGWLICDFVVLIVNWNKIKIVIHNLRFHISKESLSGYLWSLFLLIVVSLYVNSGDLIIGNLYSSKAVIGVYSVASSVAKISFFLIATPLSSVLLPKLVALNDRPLQQKKLMLLGELTVIGGMFLYGILICCKGKDIIGFLYGPQYAEADQYILYATIFTITEGMFYVFYQYKIAMGKLKCFTICTVSIGAVSTFVSVFYRLPIQFVVLIFAGAMAASVIISFLFEKTKQNEGA